MKELLIGMGLGFVVGAIAVKTNKCLADKVEMGVEKGKEIIEDIVPVYDIQVQLKLPQTIQRVYLAPQKKEITFEQADGMIRFTVDKVECHQMVVLEY